jgi:prolyl 4-hydroxylase
MNMLRSLFHAKVFRGINSQQSEPDTPINTNLCCVSGEPLATPMTQEVIRSKKSPTTGENTEIIRVKNLLTVAESDFLTNAASGCHRSTVVKDAQTKETNESRTSRTCAVESNDHKTLSCIKAKLSHAAGSDEANMEPLQVTRYVHGQQYKPHYDYFTTGHKKGDRQRVTTLFSYLKSPGDNCGGETFFPSCDNLCVKPKQGDAVMWRNLRKDGSGDTNTLHAGLPVTCDKVEKVGLNVWFGDRPFA